MHINYTDGLCDAPPHLLLLNSICRSPTLFLNINRKNIESIQQVANSILDDNYQIKQIIFDHTGDPIYDRLLTHKLNNYLEKKGIKGFLLSSEWTKQQYTTLVDIFYLNMNFLIPTMLDLPLNLDRRKYNYSCLNRNPRWHRLLLYTMLKRQNLLTNNIFTFYNKDPYNGNPIWGYTNKEDFGNYYQDAIDNLKDMPLTWLSEDSNGYNDLGTSHPAYRDAQCNIITETEVCVEFSGEKIWKPIASGQCFHIIGSVGTNSWLNTLGFETFNDVYDSTTSIIQRLEEVVNQISSENLYTKHNLDKIKHNYHHIRTGIVNKTIIDPLDTIINF